MGNQGYIYNNSFVHRLNPALKFIGFILMIVLIFLPLGYFGQLIIGSLILIGFFIAKLSFKTLFNILKSVLILFSLLLLINWALYKEPIAIMVDNSRLIGDFSSGMTIGNTIIPNGMNIYISELWGADGAGVKPFEITNHNMIESIIKQNNVSDSILNTNWNNLSHINQNGLIKLFNSNIDLAKKYYWISSQPTWDFNGKTYSTTIIQGSKLFDQYHFVFYKQNWYNLSPNAINLALYVSIKVFLMIVIATILTATTSAIELSNGLQAIFSPLRIFKLPVNEMSMMIAIALRFVPSLLIESKRILNAQASRGVDFNNGGFITKLKALTSLVVPLFSIAFKNADDLASAMETRGYNPRKARTKFRYLSVRWYDWFSIGFLGLLLGLFIGLLVKEYIFAPFGIFELGIILG